MSRPNGDPSYDDFNSAIKLAMDPVFYVVTKHLRSITNLSREKLQQEKHQFSTSVDTCMSQIQAH